MKRFAQEWTLPHAADEVLAHIATEEYLRYRYEHPNALHVSLTVEQNDSQAFSCILHREFAADRVPGFVRKLIGERFTLIQTHRWLRDVAPYQGHARIAIDGMPGGITSDLRVHPHGDDAARFVVNGEIDSKLPLIGGRIEAMLLSRVEENFAESMEAIQNFIRERR